MNDMLAGFEKQMPGRKDVMIRALGNVNASHLLDPKLFDRMGRERSTAGARSPEV